MVVVRLVSVALSCRSREHVNVQLRQPWLGSPLVMPVGQRSAVPVVRGNVAVAGCQFNALAEERAFTSNEARFYRDTKSTAGNFSVMYTRAATLACVCVAANRQLAVDKMATRRALLRRWMMYAWNFVRATRRAWPLCALFRHSHKLSLLYAVVDFSRFFFLFLFLHVYACKANLVVRKILKLFSSFSITKIHWMTYFSRSES